MPVTPSKNELARSCKIVQESCMQDLLARARDMSLFLHDSCTILHQFLQDLPKKMCKTPNLQVIILAASLAPFLARYVQDLARYVQDCARTKGHIACTCHASLACKILAQSCMILQVRFCWAVNAPLALQLCFYELPFLTSQS